MRLFLVSVICVWVALIDGSSIPAQPNAMDVYPPTTKSRFQVTMDHFQYTVRDSDKFGLRYFLYEKFVKTKNAPVLNPSPPPTPNP